MRVFKIAIIMIIAASLSSAPRFALAQDWPARPINIVMPFSGGGMMDFAIRSIANELSQVLGQSVLVEQRSGGGGVVGTASVARSDPDGYTLLVTAIGPVVFRPLLDSSVPDVAVGMTPIVMIGDTPNAILASPKLGVSNVRELLAYARAHENRLNIGHPGVGTMGEFCGLALAAKMQVDGNMIAYRGASQIIGDLAGGQIDIGTPAYGPGTEAVTLLAVGGEERLANMPDVPTLKEGGVDLVCATWIAVYGPAGLPRPIVDRLNATINAYLARPETHRAFANVGLRPLGGPPERLSERVIMDTVTWAPVVATKQQQQQSTSK